MMINISFFTHDEKSLFQTEMPIIPRKGEIIVWKKCRFLVLTVEYHIQESGFGGTTINVRSNLRLLEGQPFTH